MIIVLVMVLFFFMVAIPFFIALKELFRPKDDKPLYIDMFYSKDPLYFGRSFRRMVRERIEEKGLLPGSTIVEFSKPEKVDLFENKVFPEKSVQDFICYVSKNMETGAHTILKRDVYVKGTATLGENTQLRSLFAEREVWTDVGCKVSRWICGATNISISSNADLGRCTSCLGKMELANHCRFQSLFARPITTGDETTASNPAHRDRLSVPLSSAYPKKIKPPLKTAWRILKKYVSINCLYIAAQEASEDQENAVNATSERTCCKTQAGMGACNESLWHVNHNGVTLAPGTIINTNFVVRKPLLIKENCKINATLKGYKDVVLEKNVEVQGDIFAEGDIYIGDNCTIIGNIFSQSRVCIGNGVWISRPEEIKSVIGKKRVEVGKYAVIYGYLLSEGEGIVKW